MAYIKSRKHAVARALPPLGSAAAATLFALSLPAAAQQGPAAQPATTAQQTTAQQTPAAAQQFAQAATTPSATLKEVRVEESAASDYKVDKSANTKFTAPLLDTPQTVNVIPAQIMREQGATTLTEALRNVPGVGAFYLGENGSTSTGDAVYLRGFDTSSAIFVDGIRDLGTISRDVFNIEQVEVVKGPASTDVGRASPVGYINMITKKPTTENFFTGSVSYGSADAKRATMDLNRSIVAEDGSAMAFRLNAMVQDAGQPGRDMVQNNREGLAPSFAWGLNTPTRVFVDYLYLRQHNVPDGGVPTVGLTGYSSPDARLINSPILRRTFLNNAQPVDSSNFYGTSSDFDDATVNMLTLKAEHDLSPDTTIRNVTRIGQTQQDYMLTSFMAGGLTATRVGNSNTYRGTVPALTAGFLATPNPNDPSTWTVTRNLPTNKDQTNTIFVNQTSVATRFNTGSFGHTANFGLELMQEGQSNGNFFSQGFSSVSTTLAAAGAWPAANLYNPNPYVSGYNRIANGTGSWGDTRTVGLYGFDTMVIDPHWQLTGGVRFDHYSTDYDATALTLPTWAVTPTALSTSGDLWSGKLGVVYKPVENGSIYAGWGTSAQPPGGSNFQLAASGTGNSANRTDFQPQKGTAYEVGTKWDLIQNKLSVNGALYRTDISNEVVQDPTTLQYYQIGQKRVQGVDLSVAGALTDKWGMSGGFTTMNTSVQQGPAVTSDGTNVLAYTPDKAFTFWTTYQFSHAFTVGGGAQYNGVMKRGTDGAVGTPTQVDSYWVWNAMASYNVNKNVQLQFNVYNLFNEEYVASINKSGYRYIPGAPRSYRLTANFTF